MDRPDLRLIEYFITVAEELHFGRAAERLHIAQPSLSQQIQRLERQLGVALLERDSRNVRLTSAGQALLNEGRRTLSQARHAIQATRSAGARQLTVGFYGTAATVLLPDVLSAYGKRFPPCRCRFTSCSSAASTTSWTAASPSRSPGCCPARPSWKSRPSPGKAAWLLSGQRTRWPAASR